MKDYYLKCVCCGLELRDELAGKCPKCSHVLEVQYDIRKDMLLSDEKEQGIFRYHEFLPELPEMSMVSLQEGKTPVYYTERLGKFLGLEKLYAKHEGMNPSGSFKDRAMAVAVNRAKTLGKDTVLLASAGNAGASAAAYAARLGLNAVVVVPEQAPEGKILQTLAYGADLVKVPGGYSDSFKKAKELGRDYGFYNVATTYLNPYLVEGYKTAAYEIAEQMTCLPDWILVPIGAGPFLAGLARGFYDLQRAGLISVIPRLAGVQAENCAPIEAAYREGRKVTGLKVHPHSIASGIDDAMVGYEDEGDVTIKWVKNTKGTIIAVSEDELQTSVYRLAGMEGIYAEPASAATAAAAENLLRAGLIKENETVLLMLTGHGLKNPVTCGDNKIQGGKSYAL